MRPQAMKYPQSHPDKVLKLSDSPYVIDLTLSQYLIIRGIAVARHVGISIPANTTVTDQTAGGTVAPDSSHNAIIVRRIHFVGSTTTAAAGSLASYTLTIDGSDFGGFGNDGAPHIIELINTGGLRYSITNGSSTNVLSVSIDYASLSRNVLQSDVIGALFDLSHGGPGNWPRA